MTSQAFSVHLPAEVRSRLDALSESTGQTAENFIREAVVEHLNELEWAGSIRARAQELHSGARATRSLDEVTRELGFDPDELRVEARDEAPAAARHKAATYLKFTAANL